MLSRLAFLVLLIAGLAGATFGQEATGALQGRVVGSDGKPLAGAIVTATGPSLPAARGVVTDDRGHYLILALPVGDDYTVQVGYIGYQTVRYVSTRVQLGRTSYLGETRLKLRPVEVGELEVRVERPLIDVASTEASANLASETFESLPTGRDYRSITVLAPQVGVTGLPGDQANISGGTGPENAYYVDGVNVTTPVSSFAGSQINLPYNFVSELQVIAGGYQAEYGRTTSGIVNVVTPSGSNSFHGQLFGFFTNNNLTATPRFGTEQVEQEDFKEYDFGGSLEGPIIRDRLWFYAAHDPTFNRQTFAVPNIGPVQNSRTQHLFAGRLTWQATPSTDVVATVLGDPGVSTSHAIISGVDSILNPEAGYSRSTYGGYVISAQARQRLGRASQLELSASYLSRKGDVGAATTLGDTTPFFVDYVEGFISGGLGYRQADRSSRTAITTSAITTVGAHTLKAGAEYEVNTWDRDVSGRSLYRYDVEFYVRILSDNTGAFSSRVPTLYLQDSWRATRRATLNAGLRWENQYLISNGSVAQKFTNLWQPRLGITYQLGEPGSQLLFGSFGRFYEQFYLNALDIYYSTGQRFVSLGYGHDPRVDPSGGDTVFVYVPTPLPPIDLRGQYLDEFTLGYERSLGSDYRIGVRGVYRTLRWAVEDAAVDTLTFEYQMGNPGAGALSFLPRAKREYTALVLTLEKPRGRRFTFGASYVLSRSHGNYAGLYDAQPRGALAGFPNFGTSFDIPDQIPHSTGLLPNDRTHALKLYGTYHLGRLSAGTFIHWASGAPRNEFGGTSFPVPETYFSFLVPRGSAGRTPSVLDANLRLVYALPSWAGGAITPSLHVDVFHIGNFRTTLAYDDVRYLTVDEDGNQAGENPNYGEGVRFQPPMSLRLGLVVEF